MLLGKPFDGWSLVHRWNPLAQQLFQVARHFFIERC
jgi:hypothetical protein